MALLLFSMAHSAPGAGHCRQQFSRLKLQPARCYAPSTFANRFAAQRLRLMVDVRQQLVTLCDACFNRIAIPRTMPGAEKRRSALVGGQ